MINILYITDALKSLQHSGFINDYLNDLLFYGLSESNNISVTDSSPILCLYKEYQQHISPSYLWGKGFSSCFLKDEDTADRSNIIHKIKDKYYDYIVYGSVWRCLDFYELVTSIYEYKKIILIDGNDSQEIHPLSSKHIYFKRELNNESNNAIPIHFAIPPCKIITNDPVKIKKISSIIPGAKYSFDIEQQYYREYAQSKFAITTKKAGWDCMRHYEILANKCVPIFKDIQNCPKTTLTNLPKDMLLEANSLVTKFNNHRYNQLNDELFSYTQKNLTTTKLAQYVLEKII